ncbi:hypothetical protein ACIBJC_33375 [Streptomyces sp. NPDC050509]|uniref:hypothetical protein n=1 Tax=Streptomyces sp. NPDC050509 TaxID=3365620 RepID=UPI0037AFA9E3
MKKNRSTIRLTVIGMTACLTLGLQGAANAAPTSGDVSIKAHPTGCSNGVHEQGWSAICSKNNGGQYRASVRCLPFDGGRIVERDATVWKSSGLSIVYCPPLTTVVSGGFWTKG